ncbi:MAG: hypothetical protein CME06_11305 [Gemmatimonadetes bacterium]|nr:hypothetical protein [Gemmatimonadota bacterium]
MLIKFDMMSLLGQILLGFLFVVPCILFLIRSMQYRAVFQEKRYSTIVVTTGAKSDSPCGWRMSAWGISSRPAPRRTWLNRGSR